MFRRYKSILFITFLLISVVSVVYRQSKICCSNSAFSGLAIDTAGWFQSVILNASGAVTDRLEIYREALNGFDELVKLRQIREEQQLLLAALRELESENEVLRRLLGRSDDIARGRAVTAKVIGRTGTPLTRMIRIDRGQKDGIEKGDAVIGSGGAVGRVLNAGFHASDVMLITDTASVLDVVVQRNRAQGIVRGVSNTEIYAVRIDDFDRLKDLKAGDIIVTSGIGALFPIGVPVGEIVEVAAAQDGLHLRAKVKPSVDISKLEHVMVLPQSKQSAALDLKEIVAPRT